MLESFIIILSIAIVVFVVYKVFELIRNRHFRLYNNRIESYLLDNGLKLIKTIQPAKEDWIKSPFEKPPAIKVSLVQIRVLGIMIDPSDTEFKIIIASDKNDDKIKIWMKIETIIMARTKIEFKKEL
ncbi:hypothetical protein GTQ40_14840 [Flavobacteriaceae bacterium R38]|nr:hypothetical protein [Flavobacteriaceae bacterium R38]